MIPPFYLWPCSKDRNEVTVFTKVCDFRFDCLFHEDESDSVCKRMPFGLANAPASFQRAMHVVLAGLIWEAVIVYLDDLNVVGNFGWQVKWAKDNLDGYLNFYSFL